MKHTGRTNKPTTCITPKQSGGTELDENPGLAQWLPIETAPKGKVEILGWSKRHGVNVGILTHYKRPEMPSRKGGWFQPTLWSPIPKLPNEYENRN